MHFTHLCEFTHPGLSMKQNNNKKVNYVVKIVISVYTGGCDALKQRNQPVLKAPMNSA